MTRSEPGLHPGDRPCIWVSAGVLSYHICTRGFQCDDCPLQQALSPHRERRVPIDFAWPRDRRYTANHLWVQRESDHHARIGLTALAAQLLNPVARWEVLPAIDAAAAGTPLLRAETRGGPLEITLPFDIEALAPNRRIEIDPIWPLADPWDSGFLAAVEFADWREIESRCRVLDEVVPEISRVRRQIGDELTNAGYAYRARTRAADGGLPTDGLAIAIGLGRYRHLLGDVFGATST